MNEYLYKRSIALGGDDGVLIINCKIPKLSIECPKLNITIEVIGEGGKSQAVFSDTSFIELLRLYTEVLQKDFNVNLDSWLVQEKAMMYQAELLDPEKMKMDLLRKIMEGQGNGLGQSNNNDVRNVEHVEPTK